MKNSVLSAALNPAAFYAICVCLFLMFCLWPAKAFAENSREIVDAFGRSQNIPGEITRVICSGAGCLRLLTYLQAHDRAVGVDSAEKGGLPFSTDARPYAIANPELSLLPLFGEFRGHDSPELIVALEPQPQVIFKVLSSVDGSADRLQVKTGIPVIAIGYGDLVKRRAELDQALEIMGRVLGLENRAKEVMAYFNSLQDDLHLRTRDIGEDKKPSVYIGGVAMRGGHGFQSTDATYAPFEFLNARNLAAELYSPDKRADQASVAKEKIIDWDPDIVFMDISTTVQDGMANGLEQLKSDPAYQILTAVQQGKVFGVFPYRFYTLNFENILANAYYIGTVLYPERFQDIDPMEKAEEISTFLNGGPAFNIINTQFNNLGFSRLGL